MGVRAAPSTLRRLLCVYSTAWKWVQRSRWYVLMRIGFVDRWGLLGRGDLFTVAGGERSVLVLWCGASMRRGEISDALNNRFGRWVKDY